MKMPNNPLLRFGLFFVSQLVSFFVIAANFRALAIGLYAWTAATDTLIVLQNMIMGKLFIEDPKARDNWSIAGATVGGACGSLLSIYVTKHLFGG